MEQSKIAPIPVWRTSQGSDLAQVGRLPVCMGSLQVSSKRQFSPGDRLKRSLRAVTQLSPLWNARKEVQKTLPSSFFFTFHNDILLLCLILTLCSVYGDG